MRRISMSYRAELQYAKREVAAIIGCIRAAQAERDWEIAQRRKLQSELRKKGSR